MRHIGTPTLLAIALTLAMPSFADNPPANPSGKNAIKNPNKANGGIQVDSFQFGVGRSLNNPVGKATSREAGSPSVGEIHVTPPSPKMKNPKVTDPCKAPNPPHNCKRPNPSH
jgi:hypothetical protein